MTWYPLKTSLSTTLQYVKIIGLTNKKKIIYEVYNNIFIITSHNEAYIENIVCGGNY